MNKYTGHLYKYKLNSGHESHWWELISKHGGIHFHATTVPEYGTTAGLEFHSIYPRGDDAPDHINCLLTGGRCWHDGTSLYAIETLWPIFSFYLKQGDHKSIFNRLEKEAERLDPKAEENKE